MITAAALFVHSLPATGAAESSLEKAIFAYNKKQYAESAAQFKSICEAQPSNEIAHYYLALSYHALQRRREALQEYNWLLKNGSSDTIRNNAQLGIKSLYARRDENSVRNSGTEGGGASNGVKAKSADRAFPLTAAASATHNADSQPPADPRSYFFTQINDPKYNRDASAYNRNCGPTCLAMVFKRFNKYPSNFRSTDPQYLIQQCRILISGSAGENSDTNAKQICAAARGAGYAADRIDTIEEIDQAISQGRMVIVVGNPFKQGSYGYRVGYAPFEGGHFILVTGRAANLYVVNDPYYLQGPLNLSSGELQGFISLYKGKYSGNCVAIGL